MRCIVGASSASAPSTTASGLPSSRREANTSSCRKSKLRIGALADDERKWSVGDRLQRIFLRRPRMRRPAMPRRASHTRQKQGFPSMNKILTVALGAALVAASASAAAADANGSFFINAGVGQAQYHVGHTDGLGYKLDDKDTAGAVRFGYAWKVGNGFDLGVEGGYANLGKLVAKYHAQNEDASIIVNEKADVEASGPLLGVN